MAVGTETVVPAAVTASTIFYSLVIPAVVLYYAYYRIQRRRLYELADKLPGKKGLPFLGNALEFVGKPEDIFKNTYALSHDYKDIIRFWIGPKLMVFLFDPRDVEVILGSNTILDKSSEYRFFKPWLGEGLLISSGDKWRSHRKLIAPTFHLNVLKSFVTLFNENSRAVVEKMRKEDGKQFDVHDYMSECTVEILLETAMGVNKKMQNKSGFEYAMAVMKMCNILHLRQTKAWLRPDWLFNLTNVGKDQDKLLGIIHGLTKKVIIAKKAEISKGQKNYIDTSSLPSPSGATEKITPTKGLRDDLDDQDENDVGQKKRLAFLDLMIATAQDGVVLSDEEIKEEVDTIMFEGHDTTAAGSSFFLSMMGCHPHIQEKVVEELYRIFGDSDRPVTFQDTLELKYMERCILETLRMYPPVPVIARHINQEVKLASCDSILPAGCTVVIATFKLHRDPVIYPNPTVFDPDHFLPEKTQDRHYYAFVPFSAGPRSCVGRKYAMLKLKIILATIMRNFVVKSDLGEKDFRLQADLILKRAEGFNIRLEPRKKATQTSV